MKHNSACYIVYFESVINANNTSRILLQEIIECESLCSSELVVFLIKFREVSVN
jgi:hypothetical protein